VGEAAFEINPKLKITTEKIVMERKHFMIFLT
jgi:hypothetical protein